MKEKLKQDENYYQTLSHIDMLYSILLFDLDSLFFVFERTAVLINSSRANTPKELHVVFIENGDAKKGYIW